MNPSTPDQSNPLDDLKFYSQAIDAEQDAVARSLIARKARRAISMAQHPYAGSIPREIVLGAVSPELAEAIRSLPHSDNGGKK